MDNLPIIIVVSLLCLAAFQIGSRLIVRKAKTPLDPSSLNDKTISALPKFYGYCTVLWSVIPAIALSIVAYYSSAAAGHGYSANSLASLIPLSVITFIFIGLATFFTSPKYNARSHFEGWVKKLFLGCAIVSVSITLFIFGSIFFESMKFFDQINFFDFIFGLQWSPQTALRTDQAGSSGAFGVIPVLLGTFLITTIAMVVALPLGLLSAIFISEYSSRRTRNILKPIIEILAGVPTVVYGYFAAITMGPLLRDIFANFDIELATESAIAAGVVMGIMIIPFIMSLSDDVMKSVPTALRDASLGLGATKSETIKKVVIPAALPGIMGAFLLAVSRAIGETMIVVMAAGMIAKLSFNPFDAVTTVTAQIVRLLVGDQEFDSAKTLSAFALSLTLFAITLVLNLIALVIVKKYREKYE